MNTLESMPQLGMKRAAVEHLLDSPLTDKEELADRIIVLLGGDNEAINQLITGVPYDILDPANMVEFKQFFKNRYKNVVDITKITFIPPYKILVSGTEEEHCYVKADDVVGKEKIESGGPRYDVDKAYTRSEIYSLECTYTEKFSDYEIFIQEVREAGMKFKIL